MTEVTDVTDAMAATLKLSEGEGEFSEESLDEDCVAKWGFKLAELYRLALLFFKDKQGKAVHLTYKDKLKLVAYTKQAAHGRCKTEADVGFLDVVGSDRRQAWQALRDMPQTQAMAEFVITLDRLCPLLRPFVQAHRTERDDKLRKEQEAAERKRLEEEERVRQEMEIEAARRQQLQRDHQLEQEMQIRAALNQQTAVQFQQYAEAQYPKNRQQQEELIGQLQEQHFHQYMQQVYRQQLMHQQQQYIQLQSLNRHSATSSHDNTASSSTSTVCQSSTGSSSSSSGGGGGGAGSGGGSNNNNDRTRVTSGKTACANQLSANKPFSNAGESCHDKNLNEAGPRGAGSNGSNDNHCGNNLAAAHPGHSIGGPNSAAGVTTPAANPGTAACVSDAAPTKPAAPVRPDNSCNNAYSNCSNDTLNGNALSTLQTNLNPETNAIGTTTAPATSPTGVPASSASISAAALPNPAQQQQHQQPPLLSQQEELYHHHNNNNNSFSANNNSAPHSHSTDVNDNGGSGGGGGDGGADQENLESADGYGDISELPPLAAASLWTRGEMKEFKSALTQEKDCVITVGSGETVTVRVPTHQDGSCLFWEFATDNYDIGFGVYFEWTICHSNAVSIHISDSSDPDDDEDEEDFGDVKPPNSDPEKGHGTTNNSDNSLSVPGASGSTTSAGSGNTQHRPPTDEIIPVYRRDSHLEVYCGNHAYPGRGVYLLKFDNSYSLWRSKTLYYRVYYTS
ncbi:Golgi resident protein GCP60-like [Argonauta hians]